ncbi:GNAT family N-acetyltransferase [Psychroserpens algicola]|uniref:GNAT family N-acetyltransferase n=1 Tax=Psychroserpens algicola TaxID=1719034 RepID=A0ABT0H769_9FLAO|nr:GNAT family N-acetyltransferase [Psychroserpens algicola]MCK8480208.1 GNAT family N-acetyltransferase [Psychroserpens algicola]
MIIAETNRLVLSKFTVEDAPFILELMNTPKWLRFIGDRHVKTVEDAANYLQNNQLKAYDNFDFGYYKAQLKNDNLKPIGSFGLLKRDTLDAVDIGFSLLPEYEGQGYGLEGATAVMNLAKTKFDIKKLCAITLPENKASIHLLEKLGLSYQKSVKPFDNDEELLLFAKDL